MKLQMWIRGHLCEVTGIWLSAPDGWGAEEIRPVDGTDLDPETLTDSEWREITDAIWEAADGPVTITATYTWFLSPEDEDHHRMPLDQHRARAHCVWREHWL